MNETRLEPHVFGAFQDTHNKDWFSESVSASTSHFSDAELSGDYNLMFGSKVPDFSLNSTFFESIDNFPNTCGTVQNYDIDSTTKSNNMLEYQRLRSSSLEDGPNGLFTLDNFSSVSSSDTLQLSKLASTVDRACSAIESVPSMLERLSGSIDRICTGFERFSGSLNEASTLVERVHSQAESVAEYTTTSTSEFEVKVDNLSERITTLVATVEEIVKRERIAMEKFGNFAGRINQPIAACNSQAGFNLARQSSG